MKTQKASRATTSGILLLCGSLLSGGCSVTKAASDSVQGKWLLTEIKTGDTPTKLDTASTRFSLALDDKGHASGAVACNSWHGQALVKNDRLLMQGIASTRARCVIQNPDLRNVEHRYLSSLQAGSKIILDDQQLKLQFDDGTLWTFDRQP